MKISILNTAIIAMIAAVSFSVFGQQNLRASKAREAIATSKAELKQAQLDSAADFRQFKKDSELQIVENQKKISLLRLKRTNESKDVKLKYDKKILVLDQKNNVLKRKIKNVNYTNTGMWIAFKRDFEQNMKELGDEITNSDTTK